MWIRKHVFLTQAMVVFAFCCFTAPCFAVDPFAGRILPTQKVSFLKDGAKTAQFTSEAPLPWNTIVKCEGRAAVRMDQMLVVFEDGSSFAILKTATGETLDLKTGMAYFALKTLPKGLTFGTPQAPVVTEMMVLNASTGNQVLKGYVKAGESQSELGVLEGGRLMVRTPDGTQTINSGQRFILAQSSLDGGADGAAGGGAGGAAGGGAGGAAAGGAPTGGGLSALAIGGIGLGGLALLTGAAIAGSPSSDEGSPFTPPQ